MIKRTHKDNKRYPFTLKLTFGERAQLEHEASGMPLAEYIRFRLFNGKAKKVRTRNRKPVEDHKILARVLAKLGEIAETLRKADFLPEADSQDALKELTSMRKALFNALGMKE